MTSILVVDDDISMRNLLVDYLSQHAFHAIAASNGQQVARHLTSQAKDYITKPFGMREFLARVRVALRERPERKSTNQHNVYTFDDWRVSARHRRLLDPAGNEVKLTSGEFNLLLAFLNSPRQILSREQLLLATRVYDQEIFDRSIDVLILRLRRKLEQDASNPKYIRTERGAGYIFDCGVRVEEPRMRMQ